MEESKTPKVKKGYAPSFGWLRRPELDSPKYDCWEGPDGALYGYYLKGEIPYLENGDIVDENPKRTLPTKRS